jgi:hypothetical protein
MKQSAWLKEIQFVNISMHRMTELGLSFLIKSLVKEDRAIEIEFVDAVNNEKELHLPVVNIREKNVGNMGKSVAILFSKTKW